MRKFTMGLLLGLVLSSWLWAAPLISIDLQSAGNATRIMTAFGSVYNYQVQIPDPAWVAKAGQTEQDRPLITNPETLTVFSRRQIIQYVKGVVSQYEVNLAAETARTTAATKVTNEVVIQ